MNHDDREDARERARRVLEWFASKSGMETVAAAERRIAESTSKLEQGRGVDPAQLHEPFTV